MVCHLAAKGVLVTRAEHQASGLADLIQSHGGRAIRFPTLAIGPAPDPVAVKELLRQVWELAIFISPNAVQYAAELLSGESLRARHIAAVGEATAKALSEAGMPADLMPADRFDSEGLLALPALQQMHEQRVVIVRGEGGRPLLGDSLRTRGAKVGYAEVYRRERPATDPASLLGRWRSEVDIVTATSAEVLDNLVSMLGSPGWVLMRETPLMVISQRLAAHARELGFAQVLTASGADDTTLLAALCEWVESCEY